MNKEKLDAIEKDFDGRTLFGPRQRLISAIPELIETIRVVYALHEKSIEGRICLECEDQYPCYTIQCLEAGDEIQRG